eukprot:scaffold220786_cov22-Prasinocladus_malaysianus.AAC.1
MVQYEYGKRNTVLTLKYRTRTIYGHMYLGTNNTSTSTRPFSKRTDISVAHQPPQSTDAVQHCQV